MSRRFKLFRWRAVGPLLLFGVFLVVLWILFADQLARYEAAASLEETLGTQVDLASLRIREADAAVDLGGLAIADPRDPRRNLLEAGTITVDLDPVPLAEKKIVIDRLTLSGLQFLTTRKTPAHPADPNSAAARLLRGTEQWAREKFQFPSLALGRIDTVKNLVLHPDQLGTVRAAQALGGTVDSSRSAFETSLQQLALAPLVDSSSALVARLAKTDPKKLGLAGVKTAVTDVKQAIDRVKLAKTRVAALEQTTRASLGALQQGLADVDAARLKDYALAKSLLQLPSFDGPNIGGALFGTQSTDYFQQALFYAKLIERYVPPGLQPWNRPGPVRTRRAGTTVEYPKEREYPRFLLREGDIDLTAGQAGLTAAVAGITSQPALYGRPATINATGTLGGAHPVRLSVAGLSRHFGPAPMDSVVAEVTGVPLPAIALPGLPFSVNPGQSTVRFAFSLGAGDRLTGMWEVNAPAATWLGDSTRLASASLVESTVWRVVSGLTQLRVRADLGGTVGHPTLAVHSNLDDAIAERLRGVVGEELAKAEQKARAAVDQIVDQQVASLKARVTTLETQALQQLPLQRSQLDDIQRQLDGQLKRLGAGALPLPRL
ncbi:MAG: hypothetical protein ABI587_18370 [Gemmatimonadales bacterium]